MTSLDCRHPEALVPLHKACLWNSLPGRVRKVFSSLARLINVPIHALLT
jgi:hypothetical protein